MEIGNRIKAERNIIENVDRQTLKYSYKKTSWCR